MIKAAIICCSTYWRVKQAHPLSYKIWSLSIDQAAFEVLPVDRYYQRIGLYQTTVGISAAKVHIKHSLFTGRSRCVDFTYLDTTTYVEVIFHSQHFSLYFFAFQHRLSKMVNTKQRVSRGDFSCPRHIFYYICYCLCRSKSRRSHGHHIVCFGYVHVLAEVRTSSKQQ